MCAENCRNDAREGWPAVVVVHGFKTLLVISLVSTTTHWSPRNKKARLDKEIYFLMYAVNGLVQKQFSKRSKEIRAPEQN